MSNGHCIIFTIVALFAGFLLGYSVPAMMEFKSASSTDEVTIEETNTSDEQDLIDYYKGLQKFK